MDRAGIEFSLSLSLSFSLKSFLILFNFSFFSPMLPLSPFQLNQVFLLFAMSPRFIEITSVGSWWWVKVLQVCVVRSFGPVVLMVVWVVARTGGSIVVVVVVFFFFKIKVVVVDFWVFHDFGCLF